MNAEAGVIAEWQSLMASYPTDGWDGAAAHIANHDHHVRAVEANLDAIAPGWHDRLDSPPPRRSTPTNEGT